jgi:predicted nucleic-acid-binding Zn-ribbon protein
VFIVKQTGICPKCKGDNVYVSNSDSLYLERRTIYLRGWGKDLHISVYLCVDCGYVEEYTSHISEKTQEQIKKSWRKAKVFAPSPAEVRQQNQANWDEVDLLVEKITGKKKAERRS